MDERHHLLRQLLALEEEAWLEFRKEARPGYRSEGNTVRIDRGTWVTQRRHRKQLRRTVLDAPVLIWLMAPVIYLGLIPALLLDAYVTLYQRLCFPVYGIPKVRRRDHFVMDRRLLPYLNCVERLNCLYCSYFNGLIAYTQEIAARTEQHWCPIKHARRPAILHNRYGRFIEFGDAEKYRRELQRVRTDYADLRPGGIEKIQPLV